MAKSWIKGATSNSHGQFAAKAEKAGMSTEEFARSKMDAPGKLGKQARLAATLLKLGKGAAKKPSRPRTARYSSNED